jgi:nucleoside-diphosphate-sugar epimerase
MIFTSASQVPIRHGYISYNRSRGFDRLSHLAEALLALGNRVLAIDNLSTGQMSNSNIEHLRSNPDFHFARANVLDHQVVLDRLASQADVIFLLAAAVGGEAYC